MKRLFSAAAKSVCRWFDKQAEPVRPGSPLCSKRLTGAKLYLPTPADPASVFFQDGKEILVRQSRNVRRRPRRFVYVPPFVLDPRGMRLRQALSLAKAEKEGKITLEPEERKPKPAISKRQARQEFIEASIADAKAQADMRRRARQYGRVCLAGNEREAL